VRHVDLCSGIGGFALGFEWAGLSTPVLFCDIEKWCRDILKQHWNNVPIKSDVKELANDPDNLVPDCDILTAGYPCQPFSQAGLREGAQDDRHIWPYISKIIASKRPSWVVLENVYGHISLGLDQVLLDLETQGYATRTFVVPASSVGAPHRRDRVWIVGYTEDNGRDGRTEAAGREGSQDKQDEPKSEVRCELGGPSTDVADTASIGVEGLRTSGKQESHTYVRQEVSVRTSKDVADTISQRTQSGSAGRQDAKNVGQSSRSTEQWDWNIEPDVGRVANGVPKRVDRLKGLGNAIVPQIAQQIAEAIKVAENG
jgi:DNA (cytosine-5)-methyltransferase 1